MSPRWWNRRPQSASPQNYDQQLDSYPWTKTALGECRSPLRKHSGPKKQTNQKNPPENQKTEENHTKKEGKATPFCLQYPIPKASTAECHKGTSQLERIPLPGEGRIEWETSFHPSGVCMKVQLWFLLTQRPAKMRCREMAGTRKKGRSYQYQPCSWSNCALLCRGPQ